MTDKLESLKRAAEILGEIPSPPNGLGTQEPEYRAYKILTDEIDRLESLRTPSEPASMGESKC